MRRSMHFRTHYWPLWGRICFYLFLGLFCRFGMGIVFGQAQVFAAGPEILVPRPSSTIIARNPETHLVLRNPAGGIMPQVVVEGKKLSPQVSEHGEDGVYLHFRLPLKPGLNRFMISPGGLRLELKYQPLLANLPKSLSKDVHLFHRDEKLPPSCSGCHELQAGSKIAILGFESQDSCFSCHQNIVSNVTFQHSPQSTKLCLTCHQQSITPWRIGFPAGKIEDTCFACHTGKKAWRSRKHVHGPLNVGGCTLCHNPHGDKYRYQLWDEGSRALCVTCHGDKEIKQGENKPVRFVHSIIAGAGCVACHDPHATDNPFMLHKPINALCVGCHQALAGITRGHPVGGHPVSGPQERRRPGRELGCTSCHDPHGSAYRDLLIGSNLGGQFCRECHK